MIIFIQVEEIGMRIFLEIFDRDLIWLAIPIAVGRQCDVPLA